MLFAFFCGLDSRYRDSNGMCEEGPPREKFSLPLALGNKDYSPFYSPQHGAGGVHITTWSFEFPLIAQSLATTRGELPLIAWP